MKKTERVKPIFLDDKVEEFIEWYRRIIKERYNDLGNYFKPIKLRNFIEKMAVWYELRYPDCEVERYISGDKNRGSIIDKSIFQKNSYIDNQFGEDDEVRALEWSEFYNIKVFIASLSAEEKKFLLKARYPKKISFKIGDEWYSFGLTSRGRMRGEGIYLDFKVEDSDGIQYHFADIGIKEFVEFIKQGNFDIEQQQLKQLECIIRDYEDMEPLRDGMLNCVMYRIIERGGNRMGPKRGFLFAREFGLDIDIPMQYGIDLSDPGLRLFINEYFKAGGSRNLVCYNDYFGRTTKHQRLETITMRELLLGCNHNAMEFYTPEEQELALELANVLVQEANKRLKLEKR